MSTEEQQIICPQCKQLLVIDQKTYLENMGNILTCPLCSKKFVLTESCAVNQSDASEKTRPVNNTVPQPPPPRKRFEWLIPSENSANRYKWCRFYITMARIIAIIVVVAAIVNILAQIYIITRDFYEAKKEIPSKYAPGLVKQQNDFSDSYLKTAQRLLTANNSNFVIRFPNNLTLIEATFNEQLENCSDVNESLETLALYKVKLNQIETIMQKYTIEPLVNLYNRLNKGNAIKLDVGKRQNKLSLKLGEDANFYTHDNKSKIFDLFYDIKTLHTRLKNKNIHSEELRAVEQVLMFIEFQLYAKSKTVNVGKNSPQRQHQKIGVNQFAEEQAVLNHIAGELRYFCTQIIKREILWNITEEYQELYTQLTEYHSTLYNLEQNYRKALKDILKNGAWKILYAIIAAFMILVVADYLEAHLDTASTLRKILSKYPVLFLLLIPVFFTGCGESPKDKLEKQRAVLQTAVVNQILVEQIIKNPDANAFVVPGKSLYLISGGVPSRSNFTSPYEIVYFYRGYNAVLVNYNASIKLNEITKIKSDSSKYSHKAMMTVTLTHSIHLEPENALARGVEFCSIVPEKRELVENWENNNYQKIAPPSHDIAVVVDRLNQLPSATQGEEIRAVSIVFDKKSQSWSLERKAPEVEYITPPEMPPAYQISDMLFRHGLKKLVCNDNMKALWFPPEEYENADRIINQKLLMHNGKWKPAEVVRQTLALQRYLEKNEKKSWIEIVQDISQYPRAEQFAATVEQLENYAKTHYIDPANKTLEELALFYSDINKSQSVKKLNNGKLISYCFSVIKARTVSEANKIKKIISNVKHKIYSKNKNIISSSVCLKNESTLANHMDTLITLSYFQHLVERNGGNLPEKHHRQTGNIGGYNIFETCHRCKGKGVEIFRCQLCGGKGYRELIEFDAETRKPYLDRTDCLGNCRFRNGRKTLCTGCKGSGKYISRNAVASAIIQETATILDIMNKKYKYLVDFAAKHKFAL